MSRLAGGDCLPKDRECQLASHCLAIGPTEGDPAATTFDLGGGGARRYRSESGPLEDHRALDPEHPLGCGALFTNDHSETYQRQPLERPGKRRAHPLGYVEETAERGPAPMARWVEAALTSSCEKHSHKTVHFVNRTQRDLEDAKITLQTFDAVLISERLGDSLIKPLMRSVFGPAAGTLDFPAANRGLFTHELDSKMRAGWRRSVPKNSLKLMLQLNSLDVKLYWFADKLLTKRLQEFSEA